MRGIALFLIVLLCALSAAAAPPASIEVDLSKTEGKISPLLYGQFLEYMFRAIKGGLHSEMLENRSFEQWPASLYLPLHWQRYPDDRNDDYGLKLQRNVLEFYPPPTNSTLTNGHSLGIIARRGVLSRHGVFQPRLAVHAGREYVGYLWIRCSEPGKVRIALEEDLPGGKVLAETSLELQKGGWKQYSFSLRPYRTDPFARFCILVDAPAAVDLDQVSLMPADHVETVRRDVFDKIHELRPAFIRWPGGNVAQDYHWLWGVGRREERLAWTNLSWNLEIEPSDFGTAEFISLCRNVGAKPNITVNVEGLGATADEAAAWVEYCNGSAQTKYGALRATHGHPAPFEVKYWEIGNEIWGNWVRGHSDAETYAQNLVRYIRRMRQVDPNIKVVAVGDNNLDWNRTVLKAAGKEIDFLAIHHYYGWHESRSNLVSVLNRPAVYEKLYAQVKQMGDEFAPGHKLKLAINEWGLDLPEELQYSMVSALYAARMLNMFQRTAGFVGMSAVSDLVNGWPGGIIQVERDRLFVSPIYLVNSLYATTTGSELLAVKVAADEKKTAQGGQLDVTASRSADSSELYLHIVNLDTTEPTQARIILSGADPEPNATVYTVTSADLTVTNSFTEPEKINLMRESVAAAKEFTVELPKHSVSVFRFELKKRPVE